MPRIRTVKPEYPKNRKVRQVCRDARLLNIHLWNLADDEGRLQELPQWIIGEVFPTDEDVTPGVLSEWLVSLHSAGLIVRYEVDGERYIQCHGFTEHQKINRPSKSRIPTFDAGSELSLSDHGGLSEDSPPEQGTGKGTGNREQGTSEADATDAPLSNILADLVAANDPDGKRPTVSQRWKDAERLLIEADGRDPATAERLMRWALKHEFWRANVRSMPKFREKYGQLYDQATRAKREHPADARLRALMPVMQGEAA